MIVSMEQPKYEYIEYVALDSIDKNKNIAYNVYMMNNKNNEYKKNDKNNEIFIPTIDGMEAAKKRFEERIKKGTTKGYEKYFKNLTKSYSDLRNNGK